MDKWIFGLMNWFRAGVFPLIQKSINPKILLIISSKVLPWSAERQGTFETVLMWNRWGGTSNGMSLGVAV